MTTATEIIKKYLPQGASAEIHGSTILFEVSHDVLSATCVALSETHGLPLKNMFASDERAKDQSFKIFYVFGVPKENYFLIPYIKLVGTTEFPSLATVVYATSLYESHIHEMFGLTPVGYPGLLQPNILHDNFPVGVYPMRKDFDKKELVDSKHKERLSYKFFEVEGEGIYEVPVGPVHAGIIEPGHFRFSMAGEIIVNLEAKLGWMHKGSEKLFETLPLEKKLLLSERIAGDTSFAHSTAFAEAIESLAGIEASPRATYLRVVFGELERLACHFNDIGFILSDTGFNFGLANGTRLRERIMQLNEKLTGSRFLRGVNAFGGVTKDISKTQAEEMLAELTSLEKDFSEMIAVARGNSVILNRLEGSGRLTHQVVLDHSAVGIPARATGMVVDARVDFPYAAYGKLALDVAVETTGDVLGRYNVRISEVYSSMKLIREALAQIPSGAIVSAHVSLSLKKNATVVGIAEGWRGDVVYSVSTDETGTVTRVAVRDASFIGWNLIPHCAPGNVLLDFPLINKSFNLSYTGFDR